MSHNLLERFLSTSELKEFTYPIENTQTFSKKIPFEFFIETINENLEYSIGDVDDEICPSNFGKLIEEGWFFHLSDVIKESIKNLVPLRYKEEQLCNLFKYGRKNILEELVHYWKIFPEEKPQNILTDFSVVIDDHQELIEWWNQLFPKNQHPIGSTGCLSEGPTGCPPEDSIEESIEDSTEDSTEESIEDSTEDPIEDSVEDSTEDSIEDSTEDPIEDSIEDPIEDSVEDSIEDSIEDPTEDSIEDSK